MNNNAPRLDVRISIPRWVYYVIFTISGFSGLIYESIWSHYLKLFLGHAALAQSLVLIIFMGGMALGAWLASKFSEKLKSPIIIYVIVEAVIGLGGLLFHGVFTNITELFYSSLLPAINTPWLGYFLKWFAASMLILPQSVLLGMTFPLMTAGIIRRYPDHPGGSIAMLYFTNSIGAALGVLTSGFVLISLVGLPGTILTAGLINFALALFVWTVLKVDTDVQTKPLDTSEQNKEQLAAAKLFLIAAAITGAASFIYEVSWIRMLSLVLGSSTYAFELMLSAFITGLAFGGIWIKKRIDTIASPIVFLGNVQIIMGIFALLTIPLYVESFEWMAFIMRALSKNADGYLLFTASSHFIALLIMLPTTFFAGMTLPLLTNILLKNGSGEKSIGQIYSANTIGAIIGVLFALHVGLPLIGLKLSIVFAAFLDIALGIYLLKKSTGDVKILNRYKLVVVTVPILVFVVFFFPVSTGLLASGVYRYGEIIEREVLFHRDGTTATVSVFVNDHGHKGIATNGKPDAVINVMTNPENVNPSEDELTMILAGALPFAYHPGATKFANIGLGSGLTTHAILANDSVSIVDTVEIEKGMVLGSQLFGDFVQRAHTDPRSTIHIEDAKTFFSTHNKVYDVIVTEPSNPWVSGVSSLFTDEFYRNVKNYIAEDGLFVQWLHLYEFDNVLLMSIIKAIDNNFSDYVLYKTDDLNVILILKKSGKLPEPDWSEVFKGQMKHDLARINVNSEDDLLVRRIADRRNVKSIIQSVPAVVNSDYFPYVDLNAVKARFKGMHADLFEPLSLAQLPILEMLNKYNFDKNNITKDEYFSLSAIIHDARYVYRYMLGLDSDSSVLINKTYFQNLSILRNAALNCSFNEFEGSWSNAVTPIMYNALPFLNKTHAIELVDFVRGDCPDGVLSKHQNDLLDFYMAVAGRDSERMVEAGSLFLTHLDKMDSVTRSYTVSGVLLGYLVNEEYKLAKNFIKEQLEAENGSINEKFRYQQYLLQTLNYHLKRIEGRS